MIVLPFGVSDELVVPYAGAKQVHTSSMLLIPVYDCGGDRWLLCKQVRHACIKMYMVVT